MSEPLVLGIDVGTSGVRVAVLDARGEVRGGHAARFGDDPAARRDPALWRATLDAVLARALDGVERERVAAIAVDGTSGTLLAIDDAGRPLAAPLMYDDAVDDADVLARVAAEMPPTSAAGGATSGLAKALVLARTGAARVVHQADWIAGRLRGDVFSSDANNALKTGYDPVAGEWPDWIERTGLARTLLPEVFVPGTPLGPIAADVAKRFALSPDTRVVAGTTDGCASFLATGASAPGDAVTALGSTLVLKVLSTTPLFAPEYGLYSHRLGDVWLAGGASNSGGRVLLQHFDEAALGALSARIDPETGSGLDYYPLPGVGERFPIADPALAPRLAPRPDDDARFLHGLLEGMARIEAKGYARLAEIGAPPLASVRSVGGGAANPTWTRLRERALGVPFVAAASTEAAVGVARLALDGLGRDAARPAADAP